jgi:hypothetical protein
MVYAEFDRRFREWVNDACSKWDYPEPLQEYYDRFDAKIPEEYQRSVVQAIDEGLVISKGLHFQVKDGRGVHGPYQWFSRNRDMRPGPNWEYFIEVPEFLRYQHLASKHGMKAFFESPEEVDVSLRDRSNKTVLICEVKVNPDSILKILSGLKEYERKVDMIVGDRGNDPLRKAKYIVRTRPDWFCLAAIGSHRDFRVTYPDGYDFRLSEQSIPWT